MTSVLRARHLPTFLGLLLLGAVSSPDAKAVTLAAPADNPRIAATDLLQVASLGTPVFSPDGEFIVYAVRTPVETDGEAGTWGYRSRLWLVPADGRAEPRPLTSAEMDASEPAWRPDGGHIAFVRTHEEKSQVWLLPLYGGEAYPVTSLPEGAQGPRWTPDGEALLVATDLSLTALGRALEEAGLDVAPHWDSERPGRDFPTSLPTDDDTAPAGDPNGDLAAQRLWLDQRAADDDPQVLWRTDFHGETALEPLPSFRHWYLVAIDAAGQAGETTPVTLAAGYHSFGEPSWSPDGRHLYAARTTREGVHPDRNDWWEGVIFRFPRTGGAATEVLAMPAHHVGNPKVSPDGRRLAFRAMRKPVVSREPASTGDQVHLGLAGIDGSEPRLLTEALDRSVGPDFAWEAGGRYLYFRAASNGAFPLYRLDTGSGETERLTGFESGLRRLALAGRRLAYVLTLPENPSELYSAQLDGTLPRRLTGHNARWLANKELSPMQRFSHTEQGFYVEYWVIPPTNVAAGQTYPLILQMHGGPAAMWGPGEETMWHEFQYLAAQGYGIVLANPRGSSGYGADFQSANYRDWGRGPAADVLAALDAASELAWADPERLFLTGGSYAGYLTAWIISQDQRFRAAVAQRGVYDLFGWFGQANTWRLAMLSFGGYPWDPRVRAALERNNPLSFAENIRTPLLVIHGARDYRVGIGQADTLIRTLKILERPVEYVQYPTEGHELSRSGDPVNRIDRLLRIHEFFARYVDNPAPGDPQPTAE